MKVFYTASFSGKKKYQKYYDKVLKAIQENNVELISPEIGNYKKVVPPKVSQKVHSKKKLHYDAIKRGIQWADVVIIEVSNEDFQLGHEATIAIQNKKPVLCLSIHQDFSEKIINRYFHGAKYNPYNIKYIIQKFLQTTKRGILTQRFNFFLSPSQLQNLKKNAAELGITKAEVLRKYIDGNKNVRG